VLSKRARVNPKLVENADAMRLKARVLNAKKEK